MWCFAHDTTVHSPQRAQRGGEGRGRCGGWVCGSGRQLLGGREKARSSTVYREEVKKTGDDM